MCGEPASGQHYRGASTGVISALPVHPASTQALKHRGYTRRMKTSPRTLISLTLAASALLVLSACGNKGPLVLPQKPVPVEEQLVEPAADDATPPAADADTDSPVVPDPVDAPALKANDGNE